MSKKYSNERWIKASQGFVVTENQVFSTVGLLTSITNLCEIEGGKLDKIRDNPRFLKIFSKEDIRQLNQRARELPGLIVELNTLRETINSQNCANPEIKEKIQMLSERQTEFSSFVNATCERVPKTKMSIRYIVLFSLIYPDSMLKECYGCVRHASIMLFRYVKSNLVNRRYQRMKRMSDQLKK